MNKKNAKALTCVLLGAEGFGMMAAFVVGVSHIIRHFDPVKQNWATEDGFYLLALMAFIFGFVLRPMRRKAVECFSSVIHFGRWTFVAEGFSVLAFAVCGYLGCFWLSMTVLAFYSLWKAVEMAADWLLLSRVR